MSVRARPWPVLAGILALPFAAMTLPLPAQTEPAKAPPAVGTATGSVTVAGKFLHKVVGLALTLDHTRKVTETAYRWDLAKTPCAGSIEVTLAGGPDGPLTGTIKTTAKGEAEKPKVDVAFSAPFAKPSAAKN